MHAACHRPPGHEAVNALAASWQSRLPGLLVSRRGGGGVREGGVQWRAAESYSQGLPSVGRAAQRELPLPRKLIIFNPGRRKEGGPGRTQRKEERKKERRN